LTARDRNERGQSISLFVLVIMSALITTTGLVIDGGQKVAATSRAESAAAGAGRAASNAAATQHWAVLIQQVPQCLLQGPTLLASQASTARSPSATESSW